VATVLFTACAVVTFAAAIIMGKWSARDAAIATMNWTIVVMTKDEHGRQEPEKIWANEMGVPWMSRHGAREAVPPCFTEWIGKQLISMTPFR